MSALKLTAVERLALSRERIRIAMAQPAAQHGNGGKSHSQVTGLLGLLKTAVPSAGLLMDALNTWWVHYTAQGKSAAHLATDILSPFAKRHPLALVAGAAAVGGLLVWSRPWRWMFKPQLLAAVGPTLVSGALASGVLQAWVLDLLKKSATAPLDPEATTAASS